MIFSPEFSFVENFETFGVLLWMEMTSEFDIPKSFVKWHFCNLCLAGALLVATLTQYNPGPPISK